MKPDVSDEPRDQFVAEVEMEPAAEGVTCRLVLSWYNDAGELRRRVIEERSRRAWRRTARRPNTWIRPIPLWTRLSALPTLGVMRKGVEEERPLLNSMWARERGGENDQEERVEKAGCTEVGQDRQLHAYGGTKGGAESGREADRSGAEAPVTRPRLPH